MTEAACGLAVPRDNCHAASGKPGRSLLAAPAAARLGSGWLRGGRSAPGGMVDVAHPGIAEETVRRPDAPRLPPGRGAGPARARPRRRAAAGRGLRPAPRGPAL